jgi:glycosyltransferase involved in cell wall biosynthesis
MAQRANISVVIPSYNSEKYIGQTLQSICDQTVSDWECVVVDDGSTDGTPQIIREMARKDDRIRLIEQSQRRARRGAEQRHGKHQRRKPVHRLHGS